MKLNTKWLKELVDEHEAPCISIYLPVYRAEPPAAENPRRYREQLDQVREILMRDYPRQEALALMEKLEAVPSIGSEFWTADRDALGIFVSKDLVRVIDLQRPVDAAVFVARTFHIKPLIRLMQSDWGYHVLTLTQRQVRVFYGSGDNRLIPLDATNLPQTPDTVSRMRMDHQITATADLQTAQTQAPGEGTAPAPVLLETFMRAVDKAVWENFSRDSKYPLILCAVAHYHPQFHAISKNTHLLEDGILHDPQGMDMNRLRKEAWEIMRPRFEARVEQLKDQFMVARAHQKGSDEVAPVAEAAAFGRIDTLLLNAAEQMPGRLNRENGRIIVPDRFGTEAPHEDLLDDVAELVLKTDGEVLVLPPEMMPNNASVAAIFRY